MHKIILNNVNFYTDFLNILFYIPTYKMSFFQIYFVKLEFLKYNF